MPKKKRYYVMSCYFWERCKCSHKDAPRPGHSLCIGRKNCTSCYEWRWSPKHRKETGEKELKRLKDLGVIK